MRWCGRHPWGPSGPRARRAHHLATPTAAGGAAGPARGERPHHRHRLRRHARLPAPAPSIIRLPCPATRSGWRRRGGRCASPAPTRCSSPSRAGPSATWWSTTCICAPGAVRGVHRRPCALKRWPGGVDHPPFFTKRAPATIREAVAVRFPSARPGEDGHRERRLGRRRPGAIGLPRPEPLDQPGGGPRPPRRAAPRPRPHRGLHLRRLPPRGRRLPGPPGGAGPGGLAQDLRLAGHARLRAPPPPLDLRGGAPRRPGLRPGDRAAPPRPGHHRLVEGGAAGRLPRLQPERPRQDHRLGLQPAPHRPGLHPLRLGGTGRPSTPWR